MNKRFIETLKTTCQITDDALQAAQLTQKEQGGKLKEILIDTKAVSETQILEALSLQYNIPFWPELPLGNIGNDFTRIVPIQFLKKYIMMEELVKKLRLLSMMKKKKSTSIN